MTGMINIRSDKLTRMSEPAAPVARRSAPQVPRKHRRRGSGANTAVGGGRTESSCRSSHTATAHARRRRAGGRAGGRQRRDQRSHGGRALAEYRTGVEQAVTGEG